MKRERDKHLKNLSGYVIFFLTLAFCVTVCFLMFTFVEEKTDGKRWVTALVMLLVILFLSFLCTLVDIVRRKVMIETPVEKILHWTNRVAAGDFSARLTTRHVYGKYDEFDEIMENLNLLAEALQKTELLQSDFISSVSHELKTPVSIVRSYASLLKRNDLAEDEREKCIATIVNATGRMSDLVTNILKLNKLENQTIKPDFAPIHLTEQLTEAVLSFEDVIEKKSLVLSCELDEIKIVSSPELLSIVWNNLLSNAVKFSNEGGMVEVKLKKTEQGAVVSVSDTGEGIPPEVGKRIFEKFYQADSSRSGEGNGLGLALVKKVIDILGGEITVASEQGKGSTFTVMVKDMSNERKIS